MFHSSHLSPIKLGVHTTAAIGFFGCFFLVCVGGSLSLSMMPRLRLIEYTIQKLDFPFLGFLNLKTPISRKKKCSVCDFVFRYFHTQISSKKLHIQYLHLCILTYIYPLSSFTHSAHLPTRSNHRRYVSGKEEEETSGGGYIAVVRIG